MKSRFCLTLLLLILAAPLALAQQTTATLLGTVSDSSGAVVPGATIRVTNLANQVSRETKSDDSGAYSMPFLPSGEYSVSATADGFKVQKVDRVILGVQQTGRVDLKLELGEVTQTIDVEGGGLLLQTETSTVGTVIDSTKIVELPLNGRNFVQLAQLIPGVQAGTPGSITVRRGRGSIGQTDSPFGSTAMSANGSRDTANRYFMDGIEMMDYDAMTYSFSPSVDSLAEFKVETSTYSSELGGAPGGQINMITRSGTSAYHGTLWEFNRNDALTQVYDAIAQKDVDPPRLNRNQFGANVGGPVFLPKYNGRDKTFFFFNWEVRSTASGCGASFSHNSFGRDAQRRLQRVNQREHAATHRVARSVEYRDSEQRHSAGRSEPPVLDFPAVHAPAEHPARHFQFRYGFERGNVNAG